MALLIGAGALEQLFNDSIALEAGFAAIDAIIDAQYPVGRNTAIHHDYIAMADGGRFSLLTENGHSGASLRWFPADGTKEPLKDGTAWLLFDPADGRLRALFGAETLSPLRKPRCHRSFVPAY